MKKSLCAALVALLCLSGCSVPNSLQLDLSQGYGEQMRLLHLNASSRENRQQIEEFAAVTDDAQPLEKDISMFAYYPDYLLEILRQGKKEAYLLDLNGEFLDFCRPGEHTIYRSTFSAKDFKELLHRVPS